MSKTTFAPTAHNKTSCSEIKQKENCRRIVELTGEQARENGEEERKKKGSKI